QMAHIAIVGKPSRLRFQVSNQLNLQLGTLATIHTSIEEIESDLEEGSVAVVCLIDDDLSDQYLEAIDEFHSKYSGSCLVFIGSGVSKGLRKQFRAMKLDRCTVIDAKSEMSDLQPIVKKLCLGQSVYVREHIRHRTNQLCGMNTAGSRQNSMVKVQDISKGGLMALYRNINLKVGEVVHILMATEDGRQQHRIVGRVAWLNSGKKQFGVEFDKVSLETASLRFSSAA
ncbi:MAG: PilZ domain-containing protein, partial [Pseudomonadota bacterium]